MDIEKIVTNILEKINKLEEDTGDEFLELILSNINLVDKDGSVIDTFSGLEYGLSRSRHWDKNEKLMFHDGICEENIIALLDDIELTEDDINSILVISCEGMTDLEEPINQKFEIKIDYGK
ncbi:MAG: hypothetical protein KAI81_00785 [Candidatus Marinimicrobia bacterium]|nr:hypothetical protein [Candidatus Neomarinimicrobiota bacterium]